MAHPAHQRPALLHRLGYLLEHTSIEDSPTTLFGPPEPQPDVEPNLLRRNTGDWEADPSGYDGWLPGSNGTALDSR